MQKRVKKGISLLLCLLLCVSLLPVSAFAEDGTAAGSELIAEQPEQSGLLPETLAEEPAAKEPAPAEPEASDSGDESVAIDESNFPDTAFREYISTNFDADSDGFLSPEEIAGVTEISCWQEDLTSLEGIGLFPNLTSLDCSANAITKLDVSGNPALETLYCSENQLTELDVSGNPALKNFGPGFNQITRLDLSNNTALQTLYCNGNPLTALDVSNNAELKILNCDYCPLTKLDVSSNPEMVQLSCIDNDLTALVLGNKTALETLYCNGNQLTGLDLSGCPALKEFQCGFNQLTALDVSGSAALTELFCEENRLTALNVSGETALTRLVCGTNAITELDVSGNPALEMLYCGNNQITELDVSSNPALMYLTCSNNQLNALDLSNNTALQSLYCGGNQLTALDLSNNTNLNTVSCSGQTVTVESFTQSGEKALFDLSTLVGAENTGKITSVENGDYDPETGTASFDAPGSFTYYFSTGYGDTLMDVSCEYESGFVQDVYGDYHITSFAGLKELAALTFTEQTTIYYDGTEEFVFEEDLTLPENSDFNSYCADIRIPSGVTVTEQGGLYSRSIFVEGTLIAYKSIQLQETLNVSGSMQVYDTIYLDMYTEVVGEENISFYEDSAFSISYSSSTEEDFLAALQEAALNKPHRKYSINISNQVFSINEEITVPQNTKVVLWNASTLTVDQGVTLHVEGIISCPGTYYVGEEGEYRGKQSLVINGTVENSGKIYIGVTSRCNYVGELALGETGAYSGTGVIEVYSDTLTSPDEALPGFDLTQFDVVEGDGRWTLTLKTAEETIPGDANGDGEVNTMDLIRLMKYISGAEVDMAEGAGDVNGDGKVNTMDLIRLMKYINGEDVELL